MRRTAPALLGFAVWLGLLTIADAHHVGVFIPKDDDITKNFKDIKFAGQAGRFDVALKLFDDGIVHATMEKFETELPRGLEDGLRAALKAKNLPGVELRLAIFLAFMTRDRIRSAAAKVREESLEPEQRRDHARKLVNAAWRYYNLADFVISRQDPKAAVALRVAFEDAQTYLGGMMVDPMWAPGSNPCNPRPSGAAEPSGGVQQTPKRPGPDDGKAVAALGLMGRTLGDVIRAGARAAWAGEAKEFLPKR
ncbi:MAG: hypothetical protein HY726_00920 [Candidatus Rokubacteria bacterium]|nr:hypothetical protein [Candidatus Rokubacteria bacterium]